MKTKEFIDRIKSIWKCNVRDDEDEGIIIIRNEYDSIIAEISKIYKNNLDTCWSEEIPDELYKLLITYASTPVDERTEEKRFFIHVFTGKNGYLSFNKYTGFPDFCDKYNTTDQVSFTLKEIDMLRENKNVPIDFDKVKKELVN